MHAIADMTLLLYYTVMEAEVYSVKACSGWVALALHFTLLHEHHTRVQCVCVCVVHHRDRRLEHKFR